MRKLTNGARTRVLTRAAWFLHAALPSAPFGGVASCIGSLGVPAAWTCGVVEDLSRIPLQGVVGPSRGARAVIQPPMGLQVAPLGG